MKGLKPFIPVSFSLPYSSIFLFAPLHIIANWSSSKFGVEVIIALPPVARVGDIEVQNSFAILGLTNANSSQYNKEIERPRPVFYVVACAIIREPLSNSKLPLL